MSRLTDTRRAYNVIVQLLDQETRSRTSNVRELAQFRETVDAAFYFLGWAQFEYLVRKEATSVAEEGLKDRSRTRVAWEYLKDNIKDFSVRRRLELIFHGKPDLIKSLRRDYVVRNDIAHEYKPLPAEARNVSGWLEDLEKTVDRFDR